MIEKSTKLRICGFLLIAFGVIGIVGEAVLIATYDKHLSLENSFPGTRWNQLAFFTQATNIAVDIWFIAVGVALLFGFAKFYKFLTKPHIQGALTLYIFVVGVIYCGVLVWFTGLYSASLWWGNVVNFWHHLVVPIGMVVLFWRMPHCTHVSAVNVVWWMIYPMVYLIFAELRGLVDGWYPYPFLDPRFPLFPLVLAMLIGIFAGLSFLMIFLHNRKAKMRSQ
jgi:hypothetical protein